MSKPKTTFRQKIGLLGLGIFLTIILLEVGLRLGGLAFQISREATNRQHTNNKEFFKNK